MQPRILYLYSQVLHVGTSHARQAFQMLTLLKQAGFVVDVLTLAGGDAWPQGLAEKIYTTSRVPFGRTMPAYGSGPRRWWATVVLILAAMRLCLHKKYRAIHCADRAIRAGGFLAWLFRLHFIFEWRAASGHDLVNWLLRRSKRFQRAISLVLSDMGYPFSRLRETGLSGRVATIPFLPAPFIKRLPAPAIRQYGNAQPFHLVAFAQRRSLVDLRPLCDALPEILRAQNIRITLIGGSANVAERFRQKLISRVPEAATVEVRPEISGATDLITMLSVADLVFLPLMTGPLPPPMLLDVMASQRAILALRCPAYVAHLNNRNAALVSSEAEAIAAAVAEHMHSPLLCYEHAVAAADTVERDCNTMATIAALRSCYRFALAGERS